MSIKGYKGFNKDMTCRGFQYEEGKEYHEEMAELCNSGAATSRGSSAVGENGAALSRGNGVKVKGGLGAILLLVEEKEDSYDIKDWKAEVVDGAKIKADTWYKLENGEFVEVSE